MDVVVIHSIAVSIVVVVPGCRNLVVQIPGRLVVGLDSGLHEQCTAKHVSHVAIQTLNVLVGIGKTHAVLIRVRIDKAGTELDELCLHGVVHTGRKALVVRTGTL